MIRHCRWFAMLGLVLMALMFVHDTAEARKSGSRSFGGSRRSYTAPRSTPRSMPRTFTSPRSQTRQPSVAPRTTTAKPRSSFGGTRLQSSTQYRKSYGVPRRSEQVRLPNQTAGSPNYTVHRYGGMSDGFMMGYMMGSVPFMWSTPFHPAFYYSRPYIVENADGTKEVYPPTFSFVKLVVVLLIVGGVVFVVYVVVRNLRRRRRVDTATSSFS